MLELKLAEYKDGKFERFLELGKHFGYFGDYVRIATDGCTISAPAGNNAYNNTETRSFLKNEKDLLNRFDGLFDGRTYGKGRFVLEINNQDQVTKCDLGYNQYYLLGDLVESDDKEFETRSIAGNLHENPELWEKVK